MVAFCLSHSQLGSCSSASARHSLPKAHTAAAMGGRRLTYDALTAGPEGIAVEPW